MAEGGKPPLVDVVSHLTCGICLERYKQPKILPCSHTFCLGCLEKTLKRQEERTAGKLKETKEVATLTDSDGDTVESEEYELAVAKKIACPICKREHTVPQEGLDQFTDDFEALQAIESEVLQQSLTKSKPVNQKCASCKKESAITSHCEDCGGICQRCSDAHREFEIFAEHTTVVPIDQVTSETFGLKKRKAHLCSRHKEKATLYCDSCSQVICRVCIVQGHRQHTVSLLEEADEKLKDKVSQLRETAEKTRKVFEGYRQYITGVEGGGVGESYNEKLRAKVNKEFDERIRKLEEERRSLVEHIDSYDSFSKKKVWSEKETVELVLNKIQAGLKMAEKAQRCVNAAERIAMNSEGSKILEEVRKEKWNHESLPQPLVFQKSLTPDVRSTEGEWSCNQLAPITEKDIKIKVVDENGSKVITPKLGQPTIVEVTFQVGMVEEPKFQILYGKSHQILTSFEYEIPESTSWNIEFVPRCAGTHCVQVWVGGLAVAIKSDVTISGKPDLGSKVQPGPDWTPLNDGLLYIEGTVINASANSVEVEWKKEESFTEEREKLFGSEATVVEEGETVENRETVQETPFDDRDESTDTVRAKETITRLKYVLDTFDDYEPRSKHNIKKYQWGGLFEVELIL